MKMKTSVVLAIALLLMLVTAATAGEGEKQITVEGKIACAKCTLKTEGVTECQDVLVVKGDKGGDPAYYYLVSNKVMDEFGHTCQGTKMATVSGTVMEKESKMWLTPSEMKQLEKKG